MPRFSCAACGPASLRGDGSRRLKQFECSECSNEDGKFDSSDFDKYFLCLNESCRRKITRSCMSDLVNSSKQAHAKMKIGEELHDPTGFWSAVLEMVALGNDTTGEDLVELHDGVKHNTVRTCILAASLCDVLCEATYSRLRTGHTSYERRAKEWQLTSYQ